MKTLLPTRRVFRSLRRAPRKLSRSAARLMTMWAFVPRCLYRAAAISVLGAGLLFAPASTPAALAAEQFWNGPASGPSAIWDASTPNWGPPPGSLFVSGNAVVFGSSAYTASGTVAIAGGGVTIGSSGANPGLRIAGGDWTFTGGAITGGEIHFAASGGLTFDTRSLTQRITVAAGASAAAPIEAAIAAQSGKTLTFDRLGGAGSSYGGAIYAGAYTHLTLGATGGTLIFKNNSADYGGAIYADTLTISNGTNSFTGNQTTYGSGGAVRADTLTISGGTNTFSNNLASFHGGAVTATSLTISGGTNTFSNNSAGSYGGAVYIYSDGTFIAKDGDLTFQGNTQKRGGTTAEPNAIYAYNSSGGHTLTLGAASGKSVLLFDPVESNSAYADLAIAINPDATHTGTVRFDTYQSKVHGNTTVSHGIMALTGGAAFGAATNNPSFTLKQGATLAADAGINAATAAGNTVKATTITLEGGSLIVADMAGAVKQGAAGATTNLTLTGALGVSGGDGTGNIKIDAQNAGAFDGQYLLISSSSGFNFTGHYSGTINGAAPGGHLGPNPRYGVGDFDSATAGKLFLEVTGADIARTATWTNASGNDVWDETSDNWNLSGGSTFHVFKQGDDAVFGGGSPAGTITLAADMTVGDMTLSGGDFRFLPKAAGVGLTGARLSQTAGNNAILLPLDMDTLSVSGGRLTLGPAIVSNTLTLSGGGLDLAGTAAVARLISSNSPTLRFLPGASLSLAGPSSLTGLVDIDLFRDKTLAAISLGAGASLSLNQAGLLLRHTGLTNDSGSWLLVSGPYSGAFSSTQIGTATLTGTLRYDTAGGKVLFDGQYVVADDNLPGLSTLSPNAQRAWPGFRDAFYKHPNAFMKLLDAYYTSPAAFHAALLDMLPYMSAEGAISQGLYAQHAHNAAVQAALAYAFPYADRVSGQSFAPQTLQAGFNGQGFSPDAVGRRDQARATGRYADRLSALDGNFGFASSTYSVLDAWRPASSIGRNLVGGSGATPFTSGNRLSGSFSPLSAAYAATDGYGIRFWGGYFGDFAHHDNRDRYAGYDADHNGFLLGASFGLGERWTFGAYAGYTSGETRYNGIRTRIDTDATHLGAFARYRCSGFRITGDLAYSFTDNDARRTVPTGLGDSHMKGSFDQNIFGGGLELAYDWSPASDPATVLTPFLAARYSHLEQDGFTEKGDLALQMDGTNADSFGTSLGLAAARDFALRENLILTPRLSAAWFHQWADTTVSTDSNFTSSPVNFMTRSVKEDRDALQLGVGLDLLIKQSSGWDLGLKLGYNADLRESSNDQTVFAGFEVKF